MNLQWKHMLSPSSLRLKNNWGTRQKWWGENLEIYQSCRQLTLEHDTLCFVSGWDILLCIIDLTGFGPFNFLLPSNLCSVIMTTDPMDPKASKLPVLLSICSRVFLLQLHLPLILSKIILHPFVSRRWCGIHYGPPSTQFLSIDFKSLSRKLTKRRYLRACMP